MFMKLDYQRSTEAKHYPARWFRQRVPTGENKQPSASTNDPDTMDPGMAVEDFISTGRTGRRNAVADISDPCIGSVSTAGMDFSFDKLSVTDPKATTTEGGQSGAPCPPENSPSPSSKS